MSVMKRDARDILASPKRDANYEANFVSSPRLPFHCHSVRGGVGVVRDGPHNVSAQCSQDTTCRIVSHEYAIGAKFGCHLGVGCQFAIIGSKLLRSGA